ncbi:50S ribosomal protein L11 methyltransferase [Silicimonas algicola]|uniref:Ribosomal protein L11 methyltransferase n=1 Tax=Silicimonas algicola TaxID=1826607 RepID=A0A316GFI4_9RHOB|nr:50S ribosomal protein L11 methyltransferase [Silicimonas algicola]AZQ66383.1 50S ribosomal protein L11 methyltransferase [Silicimonas algicola]PWK58716.1 [LSU ribosomal protein L11P]-lysine N-methyltransferase [Silicimonas algicola]
MSTWTALTTLNDRARAEALVEAVEVLDPFGVGIFEIEDGSNTWEVGVYFEDRPDDVALALLAASEGARPFTVSEVPDTDWVAHVKRELTPVEAGRFFVYGSHDADRVPEGRVALLIEAAMAFGTGHHGTTLGCLRVIDRMRDEGVRPARIADIGCGTAVLAMAAASVWDAEVVASDIDLVAVEVARVNLDANGLSGRVETVEAVGFDHPRLGGPFDLVLANILKGPLIDLAPDMARVIAAGGTAILSGILVDQADSVVSHYEQAGFSLAHREDIVDWTTLRLTRKDPDS